MKKLVLITALIAASAVAVPAMADNGQHHKKAGVHQDASNHKYVKYNNGNYKHKHKAKAKKYASNHYTTHRTNLRKWPVPTTPNNNPSHQRVVMGQHH